MNIWRYGLVAAAVATFLASTLEASHARSSKLRHRSLKQSSTYDHAIAQIPRENHRRYWHSNADPSRKYKLRHAIGEIDFKFRPRPAQTIADALIAPPGPDTAQLLMKLGIPAFDDLPPISFLAQRESPPTRY
ncbi:MAG: hypothetical protein HC850_04160 [Rhodomicrobium sp.]|nr:hypothetical protein [Rhodomicrobium sp.]